MHFYNLVLLYFIKYNTDFRETGDEQSIEGEVKFFAFQAI